MESTRVCSIGNMDAGDVNMPQGLGRYMPEDASAPVVPSTTLDENGKPTDWSIFNPKFEWYLKNHLGSTILVYGTGDGAGSVRAAYDYRATVVAMRSCL